MKSILRNVAGLAIATVLAFGMFSCNIGNNEESTPKEITLSCWRKDTHVINVEGCITWKDVIAKNGDKLSNFLDTDFVYYDDGGLCHDLVFLNGSEVPVTDVVDVKANYKVGM